ncbi:MAG: DUF6876 family protein [Waterburya sp.]
MSDNSTFSDRKLDLSSLRQFRGTGDYHHHGLPLGLSIILTDGCYFLREKAHCDWLFDAIASHLFFNPKLKKYRKNLVGLFWTLTALEDSAVKLTCLYDTDKVIDSQTISDSDIGDYVLMTEPIQIWTFPSGRKEGGIDWVALLPSEN